MSLYEMLNGGLQDGHMRTGENRPKSKIKRYGSKLFFLQHEGVLKNFACLHRAFEDDDCVSVIEQCPSTAARPPGPSLVTVQMEPTSMDLLGEPRLVPDKHSVTVETYPEPILDTKVC